MTTDSEKKQISNQLIINKRGDFKVISSSTDSPDLQNLNLIKLPDAHYPKSEVLPAAYLAQIRKVIRQELEGSANQVYSTQPDDGNTFTQEAISVIKQELDNKNILKITESLPSEIEAILQELRPDLPTTYLQQCRQAAHIFWALEQGKELIDEHGRSLRQQMDIFADQLRDSGFTWHVYVMHRFKLRNKNAPPPEEVLPQWLATKKENLTSDANRDAQFADFYFKYVEEVNAIRFNGNQTDTQFDYTQGVLQDGSESLVEANNFKAYIEYDELDKIAQIKAVLGELRGLQLHPATSKIHEGDRFVLYWRAMPTSEVLARIREVFNRHQVKARGFAQDVYQLFIQPDGSYKVDIRFSNDQSLGEGTGNSFLWEAEQYDPVAYFRRYLQLVINGAKNPVEPYLLGFIPVIMDDGLITQPEVRSKVEQLTINLSQREQFPIFTNPSRRIESFTQQ